MAGVFEMVEKRIEALQSIQSKIDSLPKEEERTEEYPVRRAPDVVLFFSFDIVNSTVYKTINYYGWAQVLNLLFKELRRDVGNQIKSSEMWRVLGDLQKLYGSYWGETNMRFGSFSQIEKDYCEEIVSNARITLRKQKCFNISFFIDVITMFLLVLLFIIT